MSNFLSLKDIKAALDSCKEPGSFNRKVFFSQVGLSSQDAGIVRKAFAVVDKDKSSFLEEEELPLFLQNFFPSAQALTGQETKDFLQEGNRDRDGKMAEDEFRSLVKA